MQKIKRIIVTGAGGSAAHNFIESLRLAGEKFYIVGTDVNKYHMPLSGADLYYQIPQADSPQYIPTLNQLVTKENIAFIHPQPDVEVHCLAANRRKIKARLFLPAIKTIDLCQDKIKFNQVIKQAGIETPESFQVKSPAALKYGFQALKKNHEKIWIRAIRGAGSKAALPVTKLAHAQAWIQYWIDLKGLAWSDFMIAEYLPGREYAFQSLWSRGRLLMSQARERLQYLFGNIMPSGQTSTPSLARTVNNQAVNQTAYRAIQAVDRRAHGIFCVDLKENQHGQPCVTEVNAGRFFTTSNFFTQAGMNMPYYYIQLGFGEKLDFTQFKKFDNLAPNIYWSRMVDMGYKMFKKDEWPIAEI